MSLTVINCWKRRGPTTMTPHQRFWEKVDTSGDCWVWLAARDRDGYGFFHYRKFDRAHRAALVLTGTELRPGDHVCHHCDNPSCVRPSHLFVGTNQDNVNDKIAKGWSGAGENNPNVKLSYRDVRWIRKARAARIVTLKEVSARFGITPGHACMVAKRRRRADG